jgi:hypothetical protein
LKKKEKEKEKKSHCISISAIKISPQGVYSPRPDDTSRGIVQLMGEK